MSAIRPHAGSELSSRPVLSWRRAGLRIGISAVVLALLFAFIPFSDVLAAITRLRPAVWGLALVCYLGLHLIGVIKWRILINAAGAGLGFFQAVRAYFAGLFGNTFLPSIVGGDVVRAGMAYRVAESKTGLVFGSLIDRVLDVAGLAAVAGIGALLVPSALDPRSRNTFLAVTAVLLLALAGAIALVAALRPRRFSFKVRRRMVRVRKVGRAVRRRPAAVAVAFSSGMILQCSLVALNSWLGAQAGIAIPFHVWLFVWPLAKLSGIAPTQNGIGVREAALVTLFVPFGVPAELALAAGLIFEVIIISGGLVAGALAFAMGRFGAAPTPGGTERGEIYDVPRAAALDESRK